MSARCDLENISEEYAEWNRRDKGGLRKAEAPKENPCTHDWEAENEKGWRCRKCNAVT